MYRFRYNVPPIRCRHNGTIEISFFLNLICTPLYLCFDVSALYSFNASTFDIVGRQEWHLACEIKYKKAIRAASIYVLWSDY